MGTSNFRSMVEFDIYAWTYDCDNEDFKEYLRDCYPEYIDENGNIIENMGFYDLVGENAHCEWEYIEGCLKPKMNELNEGLIFHELEFMDGYYEGVQIFVNEKPYDYLYRVNNVSYETFTDALSSVWCDEYYGYSIYDNENTWYSTKHKRRFMAKYLKEIETIQKWLDDNARRCGFKPYGVYAKFSNGETWYTEVDE